MRVAQLPVDEALWAELIDDFNFLTRGAIGSRQPIVLGGNYRHVFDELQRLDTRPFQVDVIRPARVDTTEVPPELRAALECAVGAALELVRPLLGLAAAVVQLGRAAWVTLWPDVGGDVRDVSGPLHMLRQSLRAAADGHAAVVLFDEADGAAGRAMFDIVMNNRHQLRDRELLVVFGVDWGTELDPGTGPTDSLAHAPAVLGDIRQYFGDGKVRWRRVPLLTDDRLTRWIGPTEPVLVRRIIAISGGRDDLAQRLWDRWHGERHVDQVNGRWTATRATDPVDDEIQDVILAKIPDTSRHRLIYEALVAAAHSGRTFSADAVALVVSRRANIDIGDVVTAIDDLAADDHDPRWLVGTRTCATVTEPDGTHSYHWLYEFAGDWLPLHLVATRTTYSERLEQSGELLVATQQVHQHHPDFDGCCLALAKVTGDRDAEQFFQHRLDSTAELRNLALLVADFKINADHLDPNHLPRLLEVAFRSIQVGHTTDAIDVATIATRIAGMSGVAPHTAAIAHGYLGVALRVGGRVEEAIGELTTARDLHQHLHDAESANLTYRRELAIALADLGVALREGGRVAEAIGELTRARDLFQRLHDAEPADLTFGRELAIAHGDLGVAASGGGPC